MPTYTFRDKETGEVFDKLVKLAELDQYLKDNPNLEKCLSAPCFKFDDYFVGGRKQPDENFKDILRNIRDCAPGGKHLQSKYL